MIPNEIQSDGFGHFPEKKRANTKVDAVPANNEAKRFTRPEKVEVLPSNIKRKTEKKAESPKGRPNTKAQAQVGGGFCKAAVNPRSGFVSLEKGKRLVVREGAINKSPMNPKVQKLADSCSIAK